MKQWFLCTFLLAILLPYCKTRQPALRPADGYSQVFHRYKGRYSRIYVLSYPQITSAHQYRVLGLRKGSWEVVDGYLSRVQTGRDSVVQREGINGFWTDSLLRSLHPETLPTESQLPLCLESLDSSRVVVEPRRGMTDYADYISLQLEYDLPAGRGRLVYSDPNLTRRICPDSEERRRFYEMVLAMQGVH
jgi:hypothetical protein